MTFKETLDNIPIPPLIECGVPLEKLYRLKSFFHILDNAQQTLNPQDTLDLINQSIVIVEDCHSNIAAEKDPGLIYNGRMYPIHEDFIERKIDGRIVALTKGNKIIIEADGSFSIFTRFDNINLFEKRNGI